MSKNTKKSTQIPTIQAKRPAGKTRRSQGNPRNSPKHRPKSEKPVRFSTLVSPHKDNPEQTFSEWLKDYNESLGVLLNQISSLSIPKKASQSSSPVRHFLCSDLNELEW